MITLQAVSTGSYIDAESGQMAPEDPTPIIARTTTHTLRFDAVSPTNPPPLRREAIPAPRPGCTWMPGYWVWNDVSKAWGWATGQWKCAASTPVSPTGPAKEGQDTPTILAIKVGTGQATDAERQQFEVIKQQIAATAKTPWYKSWKVLLGVGAGVAAIGGGAYYLTRSR